MIAIGRQNGGMPRISVALLRRQGTPLQSCSALWMGVATVSERSDTRRHVRLGDKLRGAAEGQRRPAVDQERRKVEMGRLLAYLPTFETNTQHVYENSPPGAEQCHDQGG
jgi:hypothetical protein